MDKYKFDPDWMKDPEVMKEVFRDAMLERDAIIHRYKKALKAVYDYAEERRECSIYLESIADYVKTSLFDIENNITE